MTAGQMHRHVSWRSCCVIALVPVESLPALAKIYVTLLGQQRGHTTTSWPGRGNKNPIRKSFPRVTHLGLTSEEQR